MVSAAMGIIIIAAAVVAVASLLGAMLAVAMSVVAMSVAAVAELVAAATLEPEAAVEEEETEATWDTVLARPWVLLLRVRVLVVEAARAP